MPLQKSSEDRTPLLRATNRCCQFQVYATYCVQPHYVYSRLVSWHSGMRSRFDMCITSAQGGREAGTNPRVPTRPAWQGRLSHAAFFGPGLQRERPLLYDVGSAAKGCPQAHVCLRYPALTLNAAPPHQASIRGLTTVKTTC